MATRFKKRRLPPVPRSPQWKPRYESPRNAPPGWALPPEVRKEGGIISFDEPGDPSEPFDLWSYMRPSWIDTVWIVRANSAGYCLFDVGGGLTPELHYCGTDRLFATREDVQRFLVLEALAGKAP
jgi:hypothetical protein